MPRKEEYVCSYLINQHKEEREYIFFEEKAEAIFLQFLTDKNYGKDVRGFRFDIYIEPTINIGHQTDSIYTYCAHLSCHIDKQIFDQANDNQKVSLLLEAALVLVKYLAKRVPLPKNFQADNLVVDFENYLLDHQLLIPKIDVGKAVIKFFDTTRFVFRITSTAEVDESNIHFDLNDIQDHINNRIAGKTFGSSVKNVDFGYELYDFKGQFASFLSKTENLKRYGAKYKNFLVVKHFDYSYLKNLDKKQQYQLLQSKILEGINDFDQLSKKPKDFDKKGFYDVMERILNDYKA